MLTDTFIADRKKDLLKEKARLEKEIAGRKGFETYGDSEDDNAQEVVSFEENISIRGKFERLLGDVNRAVAKIEKGTYGKCEMGPEEIEEERLKASPWAAVCLKHQKETEQRGGRSWLKPWTWRR